MPALSISSPVVSDIIGEQPFTGIAVMILRAPIDGLLPNDAETYYL